MKYRVLKPLHREGRKTIPVGTELKVPEDLDQKSIDVLVEKEAVEKMQNTKEEIKNVKR